MAIEAGGVRREGFIFVQRVLNKLLFPTLLLLGNQLWSLRNFLALLSKTPVSELQPHSKLFIFNISESPNFSE